MELALELLGKTALFSIMITLSIFIPIGVWYAAKKIKHLKIKDNG